MRKPFVVLLGIVVPVVIFVGVGCILNATLWHWNKHPGPVLVWLWPAISTLFWLALVLGAGFMTCKHTGSLIYPAIAGFGFGVVMTSVTLAGGHGLRVLTKLTPATVGFVLCSSLLYAFLALVGGFICTTLQRRNQART